MRVKVWTRVGRTVEVCGKAGIRCVRNRPKYTCGRCIRRARAFKYVSRAEGRLWSSCGCWGCMTAHAVTCAKSGSAVGAWKRQPRACRGTKGTRVRGVGAVTSASMDVWRCGEARIIPSVAMMT